MVSLAVLQDPAVGGDQGQIVQSARSNQHAISPVTVTAVDGDQNGTMVSVRIEGWPVDQVVAELWQRHQVTVRMVHELRPFAVRFSFAAFNTEEEVDLAVFAVGELAQAQRRP